MTPVSLDGHDHRCLWMHLNIIRQALADVKVVAEHHGIIGLGSLSRRLNADQDAGFASARAIADILQRATEQTEQRP